jgi:hypothetical protein
MFTHASLLNSVVDECIPSPVAGSNIDDNNHGEVMSRVVQDPGLYKIYEGLPELKYVPCPSGCY